jgi:N-glycosylase/DNA lyase
VRAGHPNDHEQPAISGAQNPSDEVLPGVQWGRPEWVLSPAYWAAIVRTRAFEQNLFEQPHSLKAEVCFCLLGGYGITAELNCAAYERLEQSGILASDKPPSMEMIEELLLQPLEVGARQVRYRFPRQRAARIASALSYMASLPPRQGNSLELRQYLLSIDGIGPKTASWIARNWLGCSKVAILDIHVERAGRRIGLFGPKERLPRDYFSMERKFLSFAEALGVEASVLDMAIWSTMRSLGRIAYS